MENNDSSAKQQGLPLNWDTPISPKNSQNLENEIEAETETDFQPSRRVPRRGGVPVLLQAGGITPTPVAPPSTTPMHTPVNLSANQQPAQARQLLRPTPPTPSPAPTQAQLFSDQNWGYQPSVITPPTPITSTSPAHNQKVFDPTFAPPRNQDDQRENKNKNSNNSSSQFIRTAHPIPLNIEHLDRLETVGGQLQRAREIAQMTIQEVSDNLKIRKDLIEALEQNNYETMPAPVYTRAYIRKLSELYKVDTESIIGDYDQILTSTRRTHPVIKSLDSPLNTEDSYPEYEMQYNQKAIFGNQSNGKPKLKKVLIIATLLVLLMGMVSLCSGGKKSVKTTTNTPTTTPKIEVKAPLLFKQEDILPYQTPPQPTIIELKVPKN